MWQNWVFAFGGAFATTASRVRFSFWLFPCCWKCVRPLQKSASHSESTVGPHIYKMGPTWVLATDGKTQISRSIWFCRKGKPLITHLPYGRANVTIQLHNLDILLSNEQPNPVGISLQFLTNSYQIFLHHVTAGSWRSPRGPNTSGWGGKISIFWWDFNILIRAEVDTPIPIFNENLSFRLTSRETMKEKDLVASRWQSREFFRHH